MKAGPGFNICVFVCYLFSGHLEVGWLTGSCGKSVTLVATCRRPSPLTEFISVAMKAEPSVLKIPFIIRTPNCIILIDILTVETITMHSRRSFAASAASVVSAVGFCSFLQLLQSEVSLAV